MAYAAIQLSFINQMYMYYESACGLMGYDS